MNYRFINRFFMALPKKGRAFRSNLSCTELVSVSHHVFCIYFKIRFQKKGVVMHKKGFPLQSLAQFRTLQKHLNQIEQNHILQDHLGPVFSD